jgi:elongator complex protein 1
VSGPLSRMCAGDDRQAETDQTAAEDALKYAVFLVPADTLFDAALGMYDFSLVLLVAQHAQKVRTSLVS